MQITSEEWSDIWPSLGNDEMVYIEKLGDAG
jgi:hypothetical protein